MHKKRQALTLIEMMLVILLIGLVGSALAINLKGSIQKGKQFKTQETQKKIDSVLNLAVLEGHNPREVQQNWISYVKSSPLIQLKETQTEVLDAWGHPFDVQIASDGYTLLVTSKRMAPNEEELF